MSSSRFENYRALGGEDKYRRSWLRRTLLFFIYNVLRQTTSNLRRDRTMWRWGTWKSAKDFLFGRTGLVRCTIGQWKEYLRSDFHPAAQDDSASKQWLEAHETQYTAVGS